MWGGSGKAGLRWVGSESRKKIYPIPKQETLVEIRV
jgi:hypothetical protein